ncbi:MAG: copper homeostasis protein CutC [Acidobacteriota bacterium]
MAKRVLLEVIASSLDDARAAVQGGADRLELCSALALGGLTPSLGTLEAIKEHLDVPVVCMVRPREGGMSYSEGEFEVMLRDARLLLQRGADGLVFGFLQPGGELDAERCRWFVEEALAAAAPRQPQLVFHRAFDVVANPETTLEELVSLGVTRILTSGRAAEAVRGIDNIRRYVELARGRIQILPGGGIDLFSVEEIVRATGVDQVHLYLPDVLEDHSVMRNLEIRFGAYEPRSELEFHRTSTAKVRRVRELLDRLESGS